MADLRLPPALQTLWGRRAPGARGPRAELDVDRIVRAAVGVANAEGLEAVSMARVAGELGFSTMALYRHVSNKEELYQLMWNASAFELDEWEADGETWREQLVSWALTQRRVIEENIWVTQLPMSSPPASPQSLAWLEHGLRVLEPVDAPDFTKIRLLGLISQHSLIDARMLYDERRAREAAEKAGFETDFLRLVSELADPETYPLLARIAAHAATAGAGPDESGEFLFDLGLIIDGFEASIR